MDPTQAAIKAAIAATVAAGRQLEGAAQPDLVEVLGPSIYPDGMGGKTERYDTVLLTFPGRVQVSGRNPETLNIAGGTQIRQLWDIIGPPGISVSKTARLRVSGTVYAVIDDDAPHTYAVSTRILCYEV
jgi:hypothetical protein